MSQKSLDKGTNFFLTYICELDATPHYSVLGDRIDLFGLPEVSHDCQRFCDPHKNGGFSAPTTRSRECPLNRIILLKHEPPYVLDGHLLY